MGWQTRLQFHHEGLGAVALRYHSPQGGQRQMHPLKGTRISACLLPTKSQRGRNAGG